MQELEHVDFPIVAYLEGGITDDQQAVAVRLVTVEGAAIHFCLKKVDLEKFVTFFLRIAGSLGHAAASADCAQCEPIPISAISVGELADGSGCLGVTFGSTD